VSTEEVKREEGGWVISFKFGNGSLMKKKKKKIVRENRLRKNGK
jgi:hypothetical protein